MSKKKVSRKELLKQEDAFLEAANQGAEWYKENRSLVTAGAVAVLLGILGTWGGLTYVEDRDRGASALLKSAFDIYDAAVIEETDTLKADPAATPATFATENDKWRAASEAFAGVEASGSGGLQAVARFYQADLKDRLGDKKGALVGFTQLVNNTSDQDAFYFLAVERLAYLQEYQGKVPDAISTYRKLEATTAFYSDYAAYQRARLHLIEGDKEKARSLLEKVETDFPTSSMLEGVRDQLLTLGRSKPAAAAPTANALGSAGE